MKIPRLEAMRRTQREDHHAHPWRMSEGGLFTPHSYGDMAPDSLSTSDDVGFILNRRRVIVWWPHPRKVYAEALWDEVYKRVGRSGKKLVSTTLRVPSPAKRACYDLLKAMFERLSTEGIEHSVPVSWKAKRLWWAMGVNIVAPMEVRNEKDLAEVASLAKRLIKGQSNLKSEFPEYCYTRQDWLRERDLQT